MYSILALLRAPHWSKSIFVLLGVIYSDAWNYWPEACLAAFTFCLLASAIYIYNDFQDIECDRLHPHKKQRPLANGKISATLAVFLLIILLLLGLGLSWYVSYNLLLISGLYLLINILYNFHFRDVLGMDVLCVASGFLLRILAGTIGIGLPITWWLTMVGTFLSVFIILCKRRLEIQWVSKNQCRPVLKKYNAHYLDVLIYLTGFCVFLLYGLYVIFIHRVFYFALTLPFAALSLLRFTYLTKIAGGDDDPVALFFHDNLLRMSFMFFFFFTGLGMLK